MGNEPSLAHLARRGIYLGTCSWTDPTLVESGTFYPDGEMTPSARLGFYAGQFPIVEVDATYYAPPSERTSGLWAERTPDGFTFDVKAFRLLTQHPTPPSALWKDLRSQLPGRLAGKNTLYARDLPRPLLEEAFGRFVSALLPLHSAGKLGVILFQLPPYVYPSPGARGYLSWACAALAEYQVAVEFRQQRWMDEAHRDATLSFLEEHGMSYVCVDEPQGFRSSVPPVAAVTAPIAEVRFHGRNAGTWEASGISAAERFKHDYTEPELAEWVPRIRSLASQATRVHVLMNNCYADYGVRSARLLAGLLDIDSD
jgi:uncharacterized protein YecE (DUF72 family)